MNSTSVCGELCELNVQRIQRKYEEIEKWNRERSKNIWEIPESKLQNEYNVHKFKLKYLEQKQKQEMKQ